MCPNSVLLLIGSGELYDSVTEKVMDLGLGDAVLFTESVNNVNDYMNTMDVFVLPSLFEGLPLTGVEAQINGLPCVFSDRVTQEVQITDDLLFLPLDNIRLWAEEIGRQLACGRIDAGDIKMAEFDISSQVKRLMAYYEGLLEEGH